MAISEAQFKRALARGTRVIAKKDQVAVKAKYNSAMGTIDVTMASKAYLGFPISMVPELEEGTEKQLSDIEIISSGLGLHWPQLDVDVYVPGLFTSAKGNRKAYAAALGASGGKVRSKSKSAAARENGKKGGRPRKVA